jgi:hypothetical protein
MDIVIPIVFPDYLIAVTTPSSRLRVPDLLPGFDVFPGVIRIPATTHKLPELGHAGVMFINGSSGLTKYYEYGRYDRAQLGLARRVPVPDVRMGADGHPTKSTLSGSLSRVSTEAGHGGRISGAYIAVPGRFQAMLEYAQRRVRDNGNRNREPYHLATNSCIHFTKAVVEAAGVATPIMVDPRPNSYIEELRDEFPKLDFVRSTSSLTIEGRH